MPKIRVCHADAGECTFQEYHSGYGKICFKPNFGSYKNEKCFYWGKEVDYKRCPRCGGELKFIDYQGLSYYLYWCDSCGEEYTTSWRFF
jgi:hypothetical protein